jgi:D-sedoheptulose 7-phosphate isomerase
VFGFSGRRPDNDLACLSDVSFWVDSDAYNQVENIHGIWISATVDYVIGTSIYEVSDR